MIESARLDDRDAWEGLQQGKKEDKLKVKMEKGKQKEEEEGAGEREGEGLLLRDD